MSGIIEKGKRFVMNTYSRQEIVIERGEGCRVFDEDGKAYLDFGAGIAVSSLGHSHPAVVKAITEQAAKVIHTSNLYYTRPQVELAEKLVGASGGAFGKAFFCNSGAEAIEGCLKAARKYGASDRFEVIAMEHSFHGRTMAAVTLTGQLKYQQPFKPLLPGVTHVSFNDIDALRAAVTPRTVAVLIEPVQGEGGIRPADPAYLRAARELCDEKDLLLIFDEVQCGMGRTGKLFAFEHFGVSPDLCAVAKGLGGGVPIGAVLCNERADVLRAGEHASTFGGNPLATAAALAVLTELVDGGLIEKAAKVGGYLRGRLEGLKAEFPDKIVDVRGVGLMMGIETVPEVTAASLVGYAARNGLLLVGAGADVVRFVPPLIVSEAEVDEMIGILRGALSA